MTHLSLFSGIGGIDLAAEWAGFESVGMVEREPFCQRVLAKNFKGVPIHDDITTFDGRQYAGVDLVSAGFPCQPHSLAGKRLASGDERDLWGEVVRVLGEAKPRWILGENVPGLLSSESGRFFGRVVDDLAALGFSVGWGVFGACHVGAVHRRNRVFIVAYSGIQGLEGSGERWTVTNGDATDSAIIRRSHIQEKGFERQDDEEWEARREVKFEGGGVPQNATDSANITGLETSQATLTIGSRRESRDGACGSDWRPVRGGDWRGWGIEPVLRSGDDGVSDRVARLKALGNAVVPQQVYPILKAIAEASK